MGAGVTRERQPQGQIPVYQGHRVTIDGQPVDQDAGPGQIVIDLLPSDPNEAALVAKQQKELLRRRRDAITILVQFVEGHVEELVRRVRTAGHGDAAFVDDVYVGRNFDRLNPDGRFADELREIGLLEGARQDLAEAVEAQRRPHVYPSGDPTPLHARLAQGVLGRIADVFRAPEISSNLGGDTPEGLASAIGDELLIQDAFAVDPWPPTE